MAYQSSKIQRIILLQKLLNFSPFVWDRQR